MKISAIIQARMESTRLPGKVLLPLAGKPSLWWTIKRISLSSFINEIIIATTTKESNDPIQHFFNSIIGDFNNLSLFRYNGKEDDVIGRVLNAAYQNQTDIIIDITGDCNIIDPKHIDNLIRRLTILKLDYISNCVKRDFPDGLDIQVYWTDVLIKCRRLFYPKQHCGWNIAQHPEIFSIRHWKAGPSMHWPELGLTLDEKSDYEMLKVLFDKFGRRDPGFSSETIIKFLRENPEYITNSNVRRKTPEEG